MRELTDGLARLVAIILVMITLAVGTAALSLWANAGDTGEQIAPANSAQTLDVARAER
ncbi:MAG TPA: hypothetical protein VE775_07975 [Pyrinomonadaceae bacterium]|jgi:flagellar basal body-associated protein FliL|nr:hypothetical protein [Pyrinomonadaceae bacterium]